jgi:serine protease Do
MRKISGYLVLTGSILCTLQTATGPPASALDRWIELTNNTRMIIAEIYLCRVGSQLWNVDLLGRDLLAPAGSVMVNIDEEAGCRFDLKTVFDDGTTQIRRNVNVCDVERYAISYR